MENRDGSQCNEVAACNAYERRWHNCNGGCIFVLIDMQ